MLIRILHLEDSPDDLELVQRALTRGGLDTEIVAVNTGAEYLAALQRRGFDVILSDSGIPGYDGRSALSDAHRACPDIPFIVVSGYIPQARSEASGGSSEAAAHVAKNELSKLAPAILSALGVRHENR